jgi:hypothetical protein
VQDRSGGVTDQFRAGKRLWSTEDDEALRLAYPNTPTHLLAKLLRRSLEAVYKRAWALGLAKSAAYLAGPDACRLRRGDQVGAKTRFPKGHAPANTGLRRPGWHAGRMRETQFKPGVRQGVAVKLWKPIGTERVSKDGYLERKINEGRPLQRRWRAVHLVLWESVHGPVPHGHALAFLNGDKLDIRLDNLELITRRELMARNTVHNFPKPLADVVRQLGRLKRQIRKRTERAQQDRRSA